MQETVSAQMKFTFDRVLFGAEDGLHVHKYFLKALLVVRTLTLHAVALAMKFRDVT